MRKRGLGLSVLVAAFVAVVPGVASAVTTSDDVVAVLEFDPSQLGFDLYDGYDVVTLEGAEFMSEPSEPMLPALNVQVLLPPDAVCTGVRAVTYATVPVTGNYLILPAPRPARFSSVEAAEDPQPNVTTYDSVLPFPREAARLAGVGTSGGFRIANVQVAPLSYVPATGELYLHRRIELVVSLSSDVGARAPKPITEAGARSVSRSVVNPDEMAAYATAAGRADDGGGYDYLIVCPQAFAGEFARLADWKTRKGVRAEIITLEDISTNPLYTGVDQAEAIRNCIAHEAAEHGIEWVLLGGDTDVVPTRMAYDFFYDQGIPCDLYYSDLDGTWNDDGDDRWGEVDEDNIDMYADVYVGRAPVTTAAGAAAFVDKVLEYEGAAFTMTTDYQTKMLYLGEVLWDSPDPYTDGGVACDMIDDDYVPARYDPSTKLYESEGALDAATATAALDDGYGIVMHEGHSNITRAGVGPDNLSNSDLDALDNGVRGGVWYSVGCWSAAIDSDTFGEHWITSPNGGGVAYVGNSRYGWGCPGYPGQCVSDLYSQQFFNSLFAKNLVHAGVVHADAKHHYVGLAKIDDYMRYAMYELNLLGDPEMPIWTDTPRALDVDVETTQAPSGSEADVTVTVTRAGAPVGQAMACLTGRAGDVYERATTDAAGRATLVVPIGADTEADLVVTAENSIPSATPVVLDAETGIDDSGAMKVTALMQNYPNPFNPSTSLAFALARRENVSITVYDCSGRRVAVLVDDELDAGTHSVTWDGRDGGGSDVASGTYFARMDAGSSHFETKMILMR